MCNAPFELSQEYEHSELLCVYIHALLNCFCRNVTNFSTSLLPLRNACQNCYHWCSVQEDLGAEPEDNWRAVNWEDSQLGLQRCTALGHSEPVTVCTDTNILAHHTPHLYLSTFLGSLYTRPHSLSLSLSLPPSSSSSSVFHVRTSSSYCTYPCHNCDAAAVVVRGPRAQLSAGNGAAPPADAPAVPRGQAVR